MLANEPTTDARDGFTLIEVIVAFLVLATVLGSATMSISYSSKLYRRADEIRMAGELAERLIAEKFDHRPGQSDSEAGVDGVLRWTIARHPLTNEFTVSGGRLVTFELTILDHRGQVLDKYNTIYVERQL
jgi:general secretion pathway protein I